MCLGMALLTVCSCTKEEEDAPIDGTVTDENGPITLELTNLTATTAVFKGSVNLDLYSKYDEVGIIYSLSEDMEIEPLITNVVPITNIDKNNRFEKKMRSLLYGTKYYYSSYICMNGIYKFGEIQSFTTDDVEMQVSAPTVTSTTATFKGKVEIAEDDMESLSFGIAWSTGSDFEMNVNEDTAELEEDGTFTLTISDLKMDTEYHYATCIRQVGSQYGEIKKFVTTAVSMTASATKVTQTTVTFTGQAERNKADDSIEYGILYSTGTDLKVGASGCTRKTLTDAFDSNGKYSLKVTGLSNDTKYNYCWYARQGNNYKYGPVQQFTTSSVTINLSVTSITQTTATFTGDYEQPDGSGIEIGVLYSLSSSALKADSDAVEKIKLTNKTFRQKVSDLKYNTTYYYCTYVYQSGTYKYGSVQNFKTNDVTVELSVGDITQTTATFSGKTEITESDAIEVGILYSTSSSLSLTSSSTTKKVLGNGSFSFKVEDLKNNTRYYYQYYIKQDGNYVYGERQNFRTSSIAATLSEPVVTQTTATFSGNVNLAETSEIEFGILYSTSNRLTATSSGVSRLAVTSLDNGAFSCKAEGLQHSTKYYYCYYACQDGSYTYGSVSELTTSTVNVNLSVGSITPTSVIFNGNVELTEEGIIEVGVLYSRYQSLSANGVLVTKQAIVPDSSGEFSFKAEDLLFETTYYFCYYVCQGGKYTYGPSQTLFTTSSVKVNLSVESTTQTTTTFKGNIEQADDGDVEVGILYSTGTYLKVGASNAIQQTLSPDSSGTVACTMSGLQFATTYNYCYYICHNGKYIYGPSQTFTTQYVNMSLSTDSITQTTATFNGNVELTEEGLIEVGVLYSTGENLTVDASGVTKKALTPDSSGNVSFKAEGLQFGSFYNYCYYACQNGKYTYGSIKNFMTSSITASLSEPVVTQTTATFSGNVNLAETSEIEFGILYSTSDRLTATASGVNRVTVTSLDNGAFSCKAEGLQHSTKYYYCYYACQDGSYTYGSVSELTTSAVTMNLSAESITQTTAIFTGNVELTEGGLIEVGVLYSIGSDLTIGASGVTKHVLTPNSSGSVLLKADGLLSGTNYNYCYYVCQNGEYIYGKLALFRTMEITIKLSLEDVSKTTAMFNCSFSLTETETIVGLLYSTDKTLLDVANNVNKIDIFPSSSFVLKDLIVGTKYYYRYYIQVGGNYQYGQIMEFETETIEMVKPLGIDLSEEETANCYVISNAGDYCFKTYKGNSNVFVGVPHTAEVLWESEYGNSFSNGLLIKSVSYSNGYVSFSTIDVIESYNSNALICVKDENGEVLWSWHIWFHSALNADALNMSTDLGGGLFYQWGRKDPFIKYDFDVIMSTEVTGTVEYSIANPTTFITEGDSTSNDWHYASRDNHLWDSDKKTIYDPCPKGWMMPSYFVWYGIDRETVTFSGNTMTYKRVKYGKNGIINTSGQYESSEGNGDYLGYWSKDSLQNGHGLGLGYYFPYISDGFSIRGNAYYKVRWGRATGLPIRCIKE